MQLRSTGRRQLLRGALALPFTSWFARKSHAAGPLPPPTPTPPGWPDESAWQGLAGEVKEFIRMRSPLAACVQAGDCGTLFAAMKNPYFTGDDPALTQTLGWVGAWTSQASPYAVAAHDARDVAAAVNFAREHKVRLVVKGGGHSYQGTSNAADSLLIWTRRMHAVALHEAFVPQGCAVAPTRAVSVGAGAMWSQAYDAVSTRGGGYVQGGGCLTVGVAGLVQSGGFGSFSKAFGLAAASLLEAEVVTADGQIRIANACTHPDLFWALKGGGGGSFGVLTRLTLKVHDLPETFGAVNFTVKARSAEAFRRLIALTLDHYAKRLMNPHWGEQLRFRSGDVLQVSMVFQGLTRSEAVAIWQPFFDALDAAGDDYDMDFAPLKIVATSARDFWSPTLFKRLFGFIRRDERPGAPATNVFWPGNVGEAGQVIHGYQSTWLPADLLTAARRETLIDALFAVTRYWRVALHVNKGLAGAAPEVIAAARDTAIHPAALDAFALAISGAQEEPAYPGVPGHAPDAALAREHAEAIARAAAELRRPLPVVASYLAESDYFEADWRQAFWGPNHERLAQVKARYDPEGLFTVHHGIGSREA
ncbi:FAD-dependent oxidoreductase [Niveibacterium sp. SC-1]|uniref:FAD-dependent oxidoreductase n=1 Tax=Niveibacterium sp. SC-1 TaxID=3135646 RepID=UPI00311F6084